MAVRGADLSYAADIRVQSPDTTRRRGRSKSPAVAAAARRGSAVEKSFRTSFADGAKRGRV
ncbi:hypothetical protein NJ7G_1406 [Natrinema sp. J7-2]|nr:hypothetical protein NJ7G_1406 [Natrinema sp. J7-2]